MAKTNKANIIPRNNPMPGETPGRARERRTMLTKANHKLTSRKGGKVPKGTVTPKNC